LFPSGIGPCCLTEGEWTPSFGLFQPFAGTTPDNTPIPTVTDSWAYRFQPVFLEALSIISAEIHWYLL
jgi:hypothetical protein